MSKVLKNFIGINISKSYFDAALIKILTSRLSHSIALIVPVSCRSLYSAVIHSSISLSTGSDWLSMILTAQFKLESAFNDSVVQKYEQRINSIDRNNFLLNSCNYFIDDAI